MRRKSCTYQVRKTPYTHAAMLALATENGSERGSLQDFPSRRGSCRVNFEVKSGSKVSLEIILINR